VPFAEVAHDVWVARCDWFDVNVTVVRGGSDLVVVDTHASAEAAREVIDDVRALGAGDVVAVVNTHEHFDHVFGNGAFRAAYGEVPVHAHEVAAANTVASGEYSKARRADQSGEPRVAGLLATEIVPADTTFSSAVALDVGGRMVELVHPGRGHTAGDLLVRVPDADVVLAGDLVEESGPPSFGPDSHPMDWPLTLDILLSLLTPASVVVPGHGAPVDRAFVEEQRNTIGIVAETIRDLATRGVPVAEALSAAEWPYPTDHLADAVRRGYETLPRSQKRLPLV
jgi:glyoxylase-like metal-dependent hydrolase (beta-lactamase superfamily II)